MAYNRQQLENETALRWCQSFKGHSEQHRIQLGLIDTWAEVLDNYLVNPRSGDASNTTYPLGSSHVRRAKRGNPGSEHPVSGSETRELVDILTSKLMLSLFGGYRDYIVAKKRGREDAKAARTVTDLCSYDLQIPGHFFTLSAAVKDCVLFGTGIIHGHWCYEEGNIPDYRVERLGGVEAVSRNVYSGPVYDDLKLRRVDVTDFYPTPGHDMIQDMPGVARSFRMYPNEAIGYSNKGKYGYDLAAVKDAIARSPQIKKPSETYWRQDRVPNEQSHPELKQMDGLEYFGQVPWLPEDGDRWRIITILNGVVVRNVPWFLPEREIPFYDVRASIIGGRFWGLSMAEAVRFQQDAANALLVLQMDGTIRAVHPPIVHNRNDELDTAALKAWRPNTLIASDYPQQINTLRYDANFSQGWNMRGQLQNEIQKNSGALGSMGGYTGLFNRASASEYTGTVQNAMDRPEFMAQLIEKESLSRMGRGILRFNQTFLSSSDELTKRVGERPEPVQLEDIYGDFDVTFTGSRNQVSLQSRLAAFDRIVALVQNGVAGAQIPMDELIATYLEDTGNDVLAQSIGDPEVVFENLMMERLRGPQAGAPSLPRMPGGAPGQQVSPMVS